MLDLGIVLIARDLSTMLSIKLTYGIREFPEAPCDTKRIWSYTNMHICSHDDKYSCPGVSHKTPLTTIPGASLSKMLCNINTNKLSSRTVRPEGDGRLARSSSPGPLCILWGCGYTKGSQGIPSKRVGSLRLCPVVPCFMCRPSSSNLGCWVTGHCCETSSEWEAR